MISPQRKFATSEIGHTVVECSAILGLQFENKSVVDHIVEKFKEELIGLNTYVDNGSIVSRKDEIKVHNLPPTSQFNGIKDMTKWATYEFKPDLSKELGTIASNDDSVIINLNHAVGDGKYFVGIVDHIADEIQKFASNNRNKDTIFPIPFEQAFEGPLKERMKKPPIFFQDSETNTQISKFGENLGNSEKVYEGIVKIDSLANYNREKKTCSQLTAAIVTGFSMAVSALNGRQDNLFKLGGSMAANMRNEMKKISNTSPNLRHCNIFTVIPMGAHITPYTTIGECFNRINKNLKNLFENDTQTLFNFAQALGVGYNKTDDGIMICYSHLGPINIRKPIKDLYLYNVDYAVPFRYAIPLLTYAIVDKEKGRNDFYSHLRYHGNGISEDQSRILTESFLHFLKNFDLNDTVGNAYNEMKRFQRNILIH